ncbi:MAG: N,N-diacetylchitobiose transport system permease protein [Gaiellaceae bacterium]|nr:N,N-diacetylchitobiose transport system permease protein [Gaiellaceae bacterium]
MELKEETSATVPAGTPAVAAGPSPNGKVKRPRRVKERNTGGWLPYGLVLPSALVMFLVLGVPIYTMVRFSLSRYDLQDILKHVPHYWGLTNFSTLFHDSLFWSATWKTYVFMAACVLLTVVPGLFVALLFTKLSTWVRLLLTTGLVFVWAMPVLVYVNIFKFLTDREFGVLNYVFFKLGLQSELLHKWTDSTWQGYLLVVLMIAWVGLPFIAITTYAALSQVPQELVEAARVDGATGFRTFFAITLPVLKPTLMILVTLSIIWDFGVFVQLYALFESGAIPEAYWILPIYVYQNAVALGHYGLGAAASLMFVVFTAPFGIVYARQLLRQQSDFA